MHKTGAQVTEWLARFISGFVRSHARTNASAHTRQCARTHPPQPPSKHPDPGCARSKAGIFDVKQILIQNMENVCASLSSPCRAWVLAAATLHTVFVAPSIQQPPPPRSPPRRHIATAAIEHTLGGVDEARGVGWRPPRAQRAQRYAVLSSGQSERFEAPRAPRLCCGVGGRVAVRCVDHQPPPPPSPTLCAV